MKFKIEQIALCPKSPLAAKQLLTAMGAGEWAEDHVVACGNVGGMTAQNEADLSFNYDLIEGSELEVLNYTSGPNWMALLEPRVSHLGMHCTEQELVRWRSFFRERDILVAQEVYTESHTNPVIDGKRNYHYVIFDTFAILGVDIKFIVRHENNSI